MSRSLPIRRKVLFAFALPVLALAFVAGQGVLGAASDAGAAEEVVQDSIQVRSLQEASIAVGGERIAHAVGDVQPEGAEAEIAAAVQVTDDVMATLAQFEDSVLLDRVWTALAAARSTPVGRYDNFGRAASLLLERAEQLEIPTESGSTQRSLDSLQTMHRFVEAEDRAWVGFVDRTSEDLRSSAGVLEDFAVSGRLRSDLVAAGRAESNGPIQSAITTTAVMADLRARAIEDVLNPEQMIVTDRSAVLSHRDARVRWVAAIDQQAINTRAELDAAVSDALDRRNIFGLFGLFGLLVLGATAVALYQSISAPIAAAAAEANKLISDRLPTMASSFGTIKQTRPRPIPADSDDEVGQLVGAINTIQARFFDLAERESTARRQMSGRTVTIANRNAALLHELVRNVSAWRNADTSPEVRQRLFGIDHIATRMQRNIEAGLVLGGGRSERRWTKPISAVNTARLALGEVDGFSRVDVTPMDEVRLHGLVAPDVAHVLAELIENGLRASEGLDPSRSRVTVEGEWVSAGWAFLVHDLGIGLESAERERVNRALHTPGLAESTSTVNLGFILIGKTAARFGIDIRLIERPAGGTTARIVLPVDLIDPETVPSDRKRIDAGRGAHMDAAAADGLAPAPVAHQNAADAYFAQPEEPQKRRGLLRRRSDTEPSVAPAVDPTDGTVAQPVHDPAQSPGPAQIHGPGQSHDPAHELNKLLGTAAASPPGSS